MSPGSKTSWKPSASMEALKMRARMLQGIRAFFAEQDVLEVETPVLASSSITEPHLHAFQTRFQKQTLYLQTSPEFFMKRLLAAGSGDIYQVSRVFRDDECGSRHNPEFTMLEWYRTGFDPHRLMDEVQTLLVHMVESLESSLQPVFERISYQQAFIKVLGIDPLGSSAEALQACAEAHAIETPVGMVLDDRDMWLDWLMTQSVAPGFNPTGFTFIYDYPASQAALARISDHDPRVAHRFELFYGELELANGFHELSDADEQRRRFENENDLRNAQGLESVPVDEYLLAALDHGLPDCSGVALGLDRLLMVLLGKMCISEVLAFSQDRV